MTVIKRQIEASDRAVEDIAGLLRQEERDRASIAADVEALARGVVAIFTDLGRSTQQWQDRPHRSTAVSQEQRFASEACELYQRLGNTFEHAVTVILAVEAWGYRVQSRAPFNQAWRTLRGVNSLSPDRVSSAADAARRGELQPLGAFRDELRAAAHA